MNGNMSTYHVRNAHVSFVSFLLFWGAFSSPHLMEPTGQSCAERDTGFLPLQGSLGSESLRVWLWMEYGQCLLRPKGGERSFLLRRESRKKPPAWIWGRQALSWRHCVKLFFQLPRNAWLYLERPNMVLVLVKEKAYIHGSRHFISSAVHIWVCSWVSIMLFFILFYRF